MSVWLIHLLYRQPSCPIDHHTTDIRPTSINTILPCGLVPSQYKQVPMQPFINAQMPHLRLTDDACPDIARPTTAPCYLGRSAGSTSAPAQPAMVSTGVAPVFSAPTTSPLENATTICSSRKKTYVGMRDHHEWPYIHALLRCAGPLGLNYRCLL